MTPFDPTHPPSNSSPAPDPTRSVGDTRTYAGPPGAPSGSPFEDRLAKVLESYLADLEAGRDPERARVLADHPDLAPALEEALAGLEFIRRATPGPTSAAEPLQLGDFRLVREVGRGGMGVVYEAEQISLKRRVALKVLRFGPVADEQAMQRFQREAETVGRLHHTNIVPIYAIGADVGVRYYAMQFIEGRDLGRIARELQERRGPVDFRQIADWGLQAAEALAHAHQRGVIHRDIKPSNLILDGENRLWLTDFGLARRLDDVSLSLTGAVLGTPRYMSPEQAAARQAIDHRTDIYSLGATLYELVTGRPIFTAASPHEVLTQILHTDPRRPRAWVAAVPRDLETLVLKCLAKDPAHRYATAQQLAEDLRAFIAGRPIAARQPHALERGIRWVRRHRRAVGVGAGVALSGTFLVALGSWGWSALQERRLGRVQLNSSVSGALAEIHDARGRLAVPLTPVPSPKPLVLAAGAYEVRLSAPGQLSETWPLEVEARQTSSPTLELTSRWLWPPQDLGPRQQFELVPFDGRTAILTLLGPEQDPGTTPRPTRLRLLDGATGKPVWRRDLEFDAATQPGGDPAAWKSVLFQWSVAPGFGGTRVGERVADLNRDGAGDFVLVSRTTASLLAVSGADGRVLWWYHRRPSLDSAAATSATWMFQPGQSFVVGEPMLAEVDDDGVPDVLVCFRSNGEAFRTAEGAVVRAESQSRLSAISGRSGRVLWEQPVDAPWENYASSSAGAKFGALARPQLGNVQGRRVVLLAEHDHLRAWDLRSGEPLPQTWNAGSEVERPPISFAAPADPRTRVLLQHPRVREDAHLELACLDLDSGVEVWRTSAMTVLAGVALELDGIPAASFTPVDLRGDGRLEVVLFNGEHPGSGRWTFGVESLDATTGVRRWQTPLYSGDHPQSVPSDARWILGPDLDRDGARDVFAVLPFYDLATRQHGVLAAAISGATGRVIWRRHHPGVAGAKSLTWWKRGADGWPLLVMTTSRFAGARHAAVVLAAGSGALAHTLLDVENPAVADFDGDGAADLLLPVPAPNPTRWGVVAGVPDAAWKQPGSWVDGRDVDGDGRRELFSLRGDTLVARAGSDGARWWVARADFAMPETFWTAPAAGAGKPAEDSWAVVAAVNRWRDAGPGVRQTYRSLAAFSGQNGRRLWEAPDFELGGGGKSGSTLGWAYEYPHVEFADLDGDGVPEVLATTVTSEDLLRLTALAGTTGRRLWDSPLADGAMAPDPRPGGAPWADFDGDGKPDLALVRPRGGEGASHRAEGQRLVVEVLNGLTGRPVWPAPFPLTEDRRNLIWPEPTLGDLDGDRVPEVLVVRHAGYSDARGYPCELIALDGRTGRVQWTWTWEAGSPGICPPLILRAPEPDRRRVALIVQDRQGPARVLLDARGKEIVRVALPGLGARGIRGLLAWMAADLDGDGIDELLGQEDGFLVALDGKDGEVRWRLRLPGRETDRLRLWAKSATQGRRTATALDELLLWVDREVLGVAPKSGEILWRGNAPSAPVWGTGGAPHLRVVPGMSAAGRPGLLFQPPVAGSETTLIRQTWPTLPDGRYADATIP